MRTKPDLGKMIGIDGKSIRFDADDYGWKEFNDYADSVGIGEDYIPFWSCWMRAWHVARGGGYSIKLPPPRINKEFL